MNEFYNYSLTESAPRQARTADTVMGMIEQRRREAASQRVQAAQTALNRARETGMGSTEAARARFLSTTAFGPQSPTVFNRDLLGSIETELRTTDEAAFLQEAPRTAQYLADDPNNALIVQDDVEVIGRFESILNAFTGRADAVFDNAIRTANQTVDQTRLQIARDARLSLGDILDETRAQRAEEESGRPVYEGTDRRGRPQGEQIGETEVAGDELVGVAGLQADAAGIFRWINSRPASVFASDERAEQEEGSARASILDTLEISAVEAAERAALWPSNQPRREIEARLSEFENTPAGAIGGFFELTRERPVDMMFYMAEISAESGVTLLASLGAGVLTRSPTAVAATAGIGSAATSQGLFFDELVQERGYDLTTAEGRVAFLEDPRVLAEMRDQSFRYAAVVGILDAASAGMASRTLVDNPVGELIVQTLAQGALGGAGEALGRIAAGEEVNWTEVLLEALAEGVTAPIEVGGLAISGVRERLDNANQARQRRNLFNVIGGLMDRSELRQSDVKALEGALRTVSEDGPADTVYVDPARMQELFQSGAIDEEAFFTAIPEISRTDFQTAMDTGTDFMIPTSVYAARIAGTDTDSVLADHLRLRVEDMSFIEAQEYQQQIADAAMDVGDGLERVETAVGVLQGEIAMEFERLRAEIAQAQPSLTPAAAEKVATVMIQTARTQAQRAGLEVGEYLSRYMLPTVQNRDTVGPAPQRPLVSPDMVMDAMQMDDPVARTGLPQFGIIRDFLTSQDIEPTLATREQVLAAVRELQQDDTLNLDLADMAAAPPGTATNGEEMMQTATLRGGEEDASAWGIDTSKRNKVRDIALALEKRQRKLFGKTRKDQRGPKTIAKFGEWMADEIEFELQTPEQTAAGWYGPKFQAALDTLGSVVPALVDERAAKRSKMPGVETVADARALATAIFAVSSNGTNVVKNTDNAVRILEMLDETGETTTQKHQRGAAVNVNTETMIRLAGEMGAENMRQQLALTSGVVRDLNKEVKGLDGATSINGYGADMVVPRAALYLGPKLAAFYANLSGAEGFLTMDLWWTRTIRRYQGDVLPGVRGLKNEVDKKGQPVGLNRFKHLVGRPDLTDAEALNLATEYAESYARKNYKDGTEAEKAANTIHKDANLMLDEAPNGVADRKFFVEVAREAQRRIFERTGAEYTLADIQALMWYYEKRLMVDMGARDSLSISYEDAAKKVAARRHNGGPMLDELMQSPLPGALPGLERASPGPVSGVRLVATRYMEANGLPVRHQAEYAKVDVARAERIAAAYEAMEHNPSDPDVAAAFQALADETIAQYEALLELGLTFEFIQGEDPYATPADAIRDMQENKHLWVFPTDDGYGSTGTDIEQDDNPMLAMTDYIVDGRPTRVNDLFRIVHDVFGHGSEGASFGPRGEENAWQAHVRMFSPLAARAMTTETRGQNSWVNYGPFGEQNRRDPQNTIFADQKTGLLPEWATTEGQVGDRDPADVEADTFNQGPAQPDMFRSADETPVMLEEFDHKRLRDMTPEERMELFSRPGWFIVTATDSAIGAWDHPDNAARAEALRSDLERGGDQYMELSGVYAGVSDGPSFLIIGDETYAREMGDFWQQETVLTRDGLVYTDGTGRDNVPFDAVVYGHAAKYETFYSQIKGAAPVDAFSMKLQFPSSEDVAYNEGDGTSHYGAKLDSNGMIEMVHWSREPREVLDPAAAGTGQLPGPERKMGGPRKLFFGINQNLPSGYKRESFKLGGHRHTVRVRPEEMYSWNRDPDGLRAKIPNGLSEMQRRAAYEDLIKGAGYRGFIAINGPLGDAAVIFSAVTPESVEYVNDAALRRSDNFRTWFRGSSIVNEDGSPRMLFHWSKRPGFIGFRRWSHFGTRKAAHDRAANLAQMSDGGFRVPANTAFIPAYAAMSNPLNVGEERARNGDFWEDTADMLWQVGQELPTPLLKRKWKRLTQENIVAYVDYDGRVYEDESDIAPGAEGWSAFTLEQLYRERELGLFESDTVDDIDPILDVRGAELAQVLRDAGIDGIAYTNTVEDPGSTSYVILDPTDVKSPWNEGAWDLNNEDLLYQSGWHGSPHTFDRFTLNAIGSGEGAQAFGWGLYFAERRGIAEYYRDALSSRQPTLSFDNNPLMNVLGTGRPPSPVFSKSDIPYRSAELVGGMLAAYPDRMEWGGALPTWDGETINLLGLRLAMEYAFEGQALPTVDEIADMLQQESAQLGTEVADLGSLEKQGEVVLDFLRTSGMEIAPYRPGRLYEVNLPEDNELLIWDRPMRAQSPQVIEAAQQIMDDAAAAQGSREALQIGPDEMTDVDVNILEREFSAMKDQMIETIDRIEERDGTAPQTLYSGLAQLELAIVRVTSETPGLYMDLYEEVASALPFSTQVEDTILGIVRDGDMRTGEQFYYDLSALVGGDQAASEMLRHYGIPGHKFPDRNSRGAPSDSRSYNFVIYDDTRIDVANMQQQNRGSIILPKQEGAQAIINIFESADLSTMLHEAGHYQLWTLQKMARDGIQYAQEQLDEVANWWMRNSDRIATEAGVDQAQVEEYLTVGTTGLGDVDGAIHIALHEQFARGWEAYLFEGKAPTLTLRGLFESFSTWMISIYKRLTNLNVQMDDGIRAVFDKMLATDEEMVSAEMKARLDEEIATTAKEMGLDEDAYRRLVVLTEEARDEGRMKARADALAAEKRMRSSEYQRRLAEIDEEERAKVTAQPVQRAIQWLTHGRWVGEEGVPEDMPVELRFDTEMLQRDYPDLDLSQLPRGRRPAFKKDTRLSADEVAGWFGFDSGDALIQAMIAAPKMADAISTAVRQRAEQELGDIMGDAEARAESVADALHGEKHGQLIVGELRAINRLGGKSKKMTSRAQAKAIAREVLANTQVREAVQSNRFQTAERKYAEQAARLLAEGDVNGAFEAKRKQLIQHALYIESRAITEMMGKAERLAGRLKRKGTRANLAPEYLGAIDDLLETYDFRKISGKAEVRRERLQAYVDMMIRDGRENELAVPPEVLRETKRTPYKRLTARRLQGVFETMQNIEHTARFKQKLRIAQQQRDWQDIRDDVASQFEQNIIGKPLNRVETSWDRRKKKTRDYFNLIRNADTILRMIDGWNNGRVYELFKKDIDEASAHAARMRQEATDRMAELFDRFYTKPERAQMDRRRKWDGHDQSFSKWDIISIAMNMGNKDNLNRLMSVDSPGAFTRSQIDALTSNMDKRDWDFVQATWDMLSKEYWPLIADREERTTGVRPVGVEPQEVETPFGTYRGGYYPIVYDGRYSGMVAAEQQEVLLKDMMAGKYGKAQTRNGHTKERGKGSGGRTVQLGMQVLFGHMNNVIHDLAFSEPVNNTWKLLQDPAIRSQFEENGMLSEHQALEWWVQDVAAGPGAGTHVGAGLLRHMKSGFTLSKLAFNMSTVAVQVTGIAQSAALIGTGPMMKGMYSYLTSNSGNFIATGQQVKERSEFMKERETTFQRDVLDYLREMESNPVMSRWSAFKRNMIAVGFWTMQKVQYYAVDMPTWVAAYEQAVEKGMTDAEAGFEADRMVARSQASGLYADRTPIERGTIGQTHRQNEFVRLFTALGSYMFAKFNVANEVSGRTMRDVRDPTKSSFWAVMKGASDMALLFTLEAILYNLIKGRLPGDDEGEDEEDRETWAAFLVKETALSIASTMPVVRDASSALQGFGGGGAYGGVTETVGRMGTDIRDLTDGDGEWSVKDFRSFVDGAGIAVPGIPSTALWRAVDGAGLTGEEPSAWAAVLGR